MRIIFNETLPSVVAATELSNRLLQSPSFFKAIEAHERFDFSTATPVHIAEMMRQSNLEFKVETFHPEAELEIKYQKTLAYTDKKYPNTLFLNDRKLDREIEDIAATIIHESVHALDDSQSVYTFGHGNNSPTGKQNSAPYWIGNLAYKMLKHDPEAHLLKFDQIDEDV